MIDELLQFIKGSVGKEKISEKIFEQLNFGTIFDIRYIGK